VDVEDGKLAFAMRPEDIEGISFGDSICVEVPVLDGSENHSKLKLQVGKIEAGDGFASFQVRFQRTTESTTPIPRELLEEALWQDPESD